MSALVTDLLVEMERAKPAVRPFRPRSVWEIVCGCGEVIETAEPEFSCPKCGQVGRIVEPQKQLA